jgi:hypothetical protein
VAACNAYSRLTLPPAPQLLVEFHGHPEGLAEDVNRFRDLAREYGAEGLDWAEKQEDRTRLWAARHAAYRAILASRPGAKAVVTDVCVPISRLAQAVEETRTDIAASGIPGPILGHVGDGNFHAILMVDPAAPAEVATAKGLAARMAERSLRLGGTITGEHGVGFGKLGLMAAVTSAFRHLHPAMANHEVPQVAAWGEANKPRALDMLRILDEQLAGNHYVAGDTYSVADITALVTMDFMKPARIQRPEGLVNLERWYKEVAARPSAKA